MNHTTATDPRPAEPPGAVPATHDDPHDLLTPEQKARFEAYMAEPKVLPVSRVDRETGRAVPMTAEESRARWEQYLARLEEIDAEGEDPPGTWERMAREINEERRLEGRGPAFSEKDLCGG